MFKMAGRLPDVGMRKDCRIQTDHVVAHHNRVPPPRLFNVQKQLRPQWTVIPGACEAAVDFGIRVDVASAFAERNQLIHGIRVVGHCVPFRIQRVQIRQLSWLRCAAHAHAIEEGRRSQNPAQDVGKACPVQVF